MKAVAVKSSTSAHEIVRELVEIKSTDIDNGSTEKNNSQVGFYTIISEKRNSHRVTVVPAAMASLKKCEVAIIDMV